MHIMTKKLNGGGYGIKAKVAAVAITLTITGAAVVMPFAAFADTTADTIAQLQAQIASLTAQLAALSGSSATTPAATTSTTPSATKCAFTRSLTVGSKGEDVKCLQQTLNAGGYKVAASGAGSPGNETTFFGPATKAAVAKWQAAAGVTPAVGYFGPLSQAKYNSMMASIPATTTTTTTPTTTTTTTTSTTVSGPVGSGLTVTAAVDQPASALAPANAARVPFTKVVFTASADGDVRVNNVVVERQGVGSDSGLADVVLLDDGYIQYGLSKTLNSVHQANLNEPFVVKAGTSRVFYVAGDRAGTGTSVSGEIVKLGVVSVDAGTTKVNATFPIVGNGMTMNTTLTIGSVTNQTGAYKTVATTTEDIGKTAFVFTSIRVTAGSQEKVFLQSIRWNQVGSIGQGDIANVKTTVEPVGGTKTDYPAEVSADGKYYTSRFGGSGILLDKGQSAEVYIKGDIMGGSNRTIKFDLYRTSDLAVSGETYGFGITPPTSGTGFTSTNPWYFGSQITVNKGTINVENSTTVASQNVAINLSNQPVGAFSVDVHGEPVSVAQIVLNTGVNLTNVSIYDENGKVVAGPKDGVAAGTATFSDTVTFPIGKHVYTVKGKYATTLTSGSTIQASTTPSTDWTTVRGVTTGESITPTPSSLVSLATMTVKAAALTMSVSSDPPKQNVVAGAQKFVFANYLLDATASGEDIRMASIPLDYSGTTSTNLTSCQLYDGATALNTGSNIVNPTANASSTVVTFDGSGYTIPKGTVKTLAMKCNIASGATGTYIWTLANSSSPTGTGLVSGQSVTPTVNGSGTTAGSQVGSLMTLAASGTFSITLDSSSPSYIVTSAGRTAVPVSVLRFTGTNEAIRLTDLALILTGNVASSTPGDVSKVTLWDGASKVGETVFTGRNYVASTTIGTCAGCTDFIIPKNDSKLLTVKVDLGAQGVSQAGIPGALVQVDWDNASGNATKGVGVASGASVQRSSGTTTASSGVRVYKSYPTLEPIPFTSTGALSAGRRDLLKFKITAAPEGDVGIAKFTVRIATTSATAQRNMIDNVNVYAFTDSTFSTVATGVQTDGAFLPTSVVISSPDTTGTFASSWASASTDINIWAANASNASTTLTIPAGSTRYFVVRGDATLAGSTYSVSTQLQGDAKFVASLGGGAAGPYCVTGGCANGTASSTYMGTTTYIDSVVTSATTNNNFVWRPYSTTTAIGTVSGGTVLTDIDYTTGYGVPGLPTTNINPQSIAQ